MEMLAGCASDCACDTLIVSDVVLCLMLSFWVASAFPASARAVVPTSASTASLRIVFIPLPFLLSRSKAFSLDARFPQVLSLIPGSHELPEEPPMTLLVTRQLDSIDGVVITGRVLDLQARQQERVPLVQVGRRLQSPCARRIPAGLLQRVPHGVGDRHAVVVEHVVGLRAREEAPEDRLVEPDGLV